MAYVERVLDKDWSSEFPKIMVAFGLSTVMSSRSWWTAPFSKFVQYLDTLLFHLFLVF